MFFFLDLSKFMWYNDKYRGFYVIHVMCLEGCYNEVVV